MIDNKALGERIKQAREAKKLTQRQLGVTIFYAQATVCNWESGKNLPSTTAMVALSAALEVTTDWLLMGE